IQTSQPLLQIKMGIKFRLFYRIFRFRCANQIQIQSLLINKQHLRHEKEDRFYKNISSEEEEDLKVEGDFEVEEVKYLAYG
ncbi:hypothetical protein Tco_1157732, partial [Tanacetum coccineum]